MFKNAFSFALLMFVAAFAGVGLRQLEAGNYTAAGFAGFGIAAVAVVSVIRVRNWLDKRAVSN